MKTTSVLLLVIFALISSAQAQNTSNDFLVSNTFTQGQEIEIPITNNLARIEISYQNESDNESVVDWTSYWQSKALPESTIGPLKYRTTTLKPKVDNPNESVLPDRKKIVLNTNQVDKIIIRVKTGRVNIQVKPSKKRM